jgi:hypothetical protein
MCLFADVGEARKAPVPCRKDPIKESGGLTPLWEGMRVSVQLSGDELEASGCPRHEKGWKMLL